MFPHMINLYIVFWISYINGQVLDLVSSLLCGQEHYPSLFEHPQVIVTGVCGFLFPIIILDHLLLNWSSTRWEVQIISTPHVQDTVRTQRHFINVHKAGTMSYKHYNDVVCVHGTAIARTKAKQRLGYVTKYPVYSKVWHLWFCIWWYVRN